MTDTPAAILGTYSNWRTVAGRKMLQLHIEVPIEKQTEVLTALGAPDPSNPRWVAIALLDPKVAQESPSGGKEVIRTPQSADKPEKTEGERAVIRAVMLCRDPEFQKWLGTQCDEERLQWADQEDYPAGRGVGQDEAWARATILRNCGIASRSELATNPEARKRFEAIETDYRYRDVRR